MVYRLFRMAREQSFFGIRVKRAWSIQLFKTQSTPWLQPLLQNALDTYKQVNQLVAAYVSVVLTFSTTEKVVHKVVT